MTTGERDRAKRICQISLDDEEYAHVAHIASHRKITVEQWVEELVRREMTDYRRRTKGLENVIKEAAQHNIPTADIEQMLREIESGYNGSGA